MKLRAKIWELRGRRYEMLFNFNANGCVDSRLEESTAIEDWQKNDLYLIARILGKTISAFKQLKELTANQGVTKMSEPLPYLRESRAA